MPSSLVDIRSQDRVFLCGVCECVGDPYAVFDGITFHTKYGCRIVQRPPLFGFLFHEHYITPPTVKRDARSDDDFLDRMPNLAFFRGRPGGALR